MNAGAAKRSVLLLMLTTGTIAVVQSARRGVMPRPSIGIGVVGGAVLLTALAEHQPTMAVGLAGITTFGTLAAGPDSLNAIGKAMDAKVNPRTRDSFNVDTSQIGMIVPNVTGSGGSMVPDAGGDGGGGGGPGARLTGSRCVDPAVLVQIGQGGHRLAPDAADAFARAEALYGGNIVVTDSYRSCAQQASGHAADPNRFASAAGSYHTKGKAVDVNTTVMGASNPKLRSAMRAAGWCQYDPTGEPWHWSYGGCG